MTISTGVWFDLKSQQVVDSPPEEGVQIVAPGAEETPALLAEVQRYRDMADGVSRVDTITTTGMSGAASVGETGPEVVDEPDEPETAPKGRRR